MNTLDVTKFGVQELDNKEMVEIEGGAIFKARGLVSWATGHTAWSDVEITLFWWDVKTSS